MIRFFISSLLVFSLITIGKTQKMDTMSYVLGMIQANEIQKSGMKERNPETFIAGFNAVFNDDETLVDMSTAEELYENYQIVLKERKIKMNLEAGANYLEENGKRDGVVTTESGLQYEILEKGDGAIPTASDKVKTHYVGKLIDGTEFDSSVKRGQPLTFPVGGVIMGWQEALQLMPVGSKWRIYVPQDLGYGSRGAGQVIPPYSALIFDIHLLGIE